MQYTLTPINKKGVISPVGRYSNTFVRLGPFLSKDSGLPVTGLTEADERELEDLLGMNSGTLSKRSDFWETFHVPIGQEGLLLDPEEFEEHALWLRFLKANPLIANGAKELKEKSSAEFLLSSPEQDAKVSNEGRKYKKEAYAALEKLDVSDMRDILLLMGRGSDSVSNDIVEDQLGSIMEADYKRFVDIVKDENRNLKVFITKGIATGVIKKAGYSENTAEYSYRGIELGKGIKEACKFFLVKANAETYLAIEKEISDSLNLS